MHIAERLNFFAEVMFETKNKHDLTENCASKPQIIDR